MSDKNAGQYECTEIVLEVTPDAAIVSNLGVSSFILRDIEDREKNFYMTGGMGVTTPIGLGLALATDEQVTVLDGDGSMLMSLGVLTTLGTYEPSNLTVVIWNNAVFETTGGQSTLADAADFSEIARDCGLKAWEASTSKAFRSAYAEAAKHDEPSVVDCAVTSTRPDDHPSLDYAHSYMKHRFRKAMIRE